MFSLPNQTIFDKKIPRRKKKKKTYKYRTSFDFSFVREIKTKKFKKMHANEIFLKIVMHV